MVFYRMMFDCHSILTFKWHLTFYLFTLARSIIHLYHHQHLYISRHHSTYDRFMATIQVNHVSQHPIQDWRILLAQSITAHTPLFMQPAQSDYRKDARLIELRFYVELDTK